MFAIYKVNVSSVMNTLLTSGYPTTSSLGLDYKMVTTKLLEYEYSISESKLD